MFLRGLARMFLEPSSRLEPPDAKQLDCDDARKLEAAADVLDQRAQTWAKLRLVHGRNVLLRHVTGELVKTCWVIFDKSMYGIVAIIAGVLLGDCDIPESTVRNWHPHK
jgi:hypothetical protein